MIYSVLKNNINDIKRDNNSANHNVVNVVDNVSATLDVDALSPSVNDVLAAVDQDVAPVEVVERLARLLGRRDLRLLLLLALSSPRLHVLAARDRGRARAPGRHAD